MADTETIKMNLMNDLRTTNLNGSKTFLKGMNVEVPKSMADDLARRDYEATKAKQDLVRQPKEYVVPVGTNPITGQRWD